MMEASVYLVAGGCLRLSRPGVRPKHYILLGVLFALAYATKAVLFPLSILLMGLLFLWPPARSWVEEA